MGRAKLNMELISKERSKNITFKKRKEGLIRKMHEFTTLCDVSACMIIYAPKQDKGAIEPEIWPQNVEEVRRIIDIYRAKNKDSGNKTFGLSDFFHDRKRKIEEELAKLRKKNMEAKYPTWLESMSFLTEPQLREFAGQLGNKVEYVKSRIEMLKRSREGLDMNLMDLAHARLSESNHYYAPGLIQRGTGTGTELEFINQQAIPVPYPIDYLNNNRELHSVNQNSMMMLLMNDSDSCVQFGGPSPIQRASFKTEVFYEGRGVVDPTICANPRGRYYAPPLLPAPPFMMQGMAVPPMGLPQLAFPRDQNQEGGAGQEDALQYPFKKSFII